MYPVSRVKTPRKQAGLDLIHAEATAVQEADIAPAGYGRPFSGSKPIPQFPDTRDWPLPSMPGVQHSGYSFKSFVPAPMKRMR